jgi:acetolactate synthase regulatory subunit
MDTQQFYISLVTAIITEQEFVIGPIAWDQAKKVSGIVVSGKKHIEIESDPHAVINELVKQYEKLFGKASVRICHMAADRIARKFMVDKSDIPESLRF